MTNIAVAPESLGVRGAVDADRLIPEGVDLRVLVIPNLSTANLRKAELIPDRQWQATRLTESCDSVRETLTAPAPGSGGKTWGCRRNSSSHKRISAELRSSDNSREARSVTVIIENSPLQVIQVPALLDRGKEWNTDEQANPAGPALDVWNRLEQI